MMVSRGAIRAAVKAALAAHARFGDLRQVSAWSDTISAADLPSIAVATPSTQRRHIDFDTSEIGTSLEIVLKRLGGAELEDTLDADADALEVCVLSAISGEGLAPPEIRSETRLDGSAAQAVGTVTVSCSYAQFVSIE